LRQRLTSALILVSGLLLIAAVVLLVNPSAPKTTSAQVLPTPSCLRAGACLSSTASAKSSPSQSAMHNPTPTPSNSTTSKATPAATRTPTATPTPAPSRASSTPTPTPAPTPPPSSSSPPAAAGYFGLRPVGSWSSLPSDAQCAAQVHYSSWEPRPENAQQNSTRPAPGAMAASFASRPRNEGGSYNPLWDSWLLKRVDGQFTGTTDEILQWAACKWGLPDNLIRADAVEESTWFQYLHFPNDASYGGGGGSCYWDFGCGDSFSSATAASTVYCNGIATQAVLSSELHNYQKDPVTAAGGPPYTPTTGLCPKTFSILGVMSWDDPAWQAPYSPYPGNQNGTFPFTRDSTAAAADYWGAYIRGCYEGWTYWLKGSGTGTYAAGDLWGCIGSWYSGDWHTSAANTYIGSVQSKENTTIWLTAAFAASRQQYSCDAKYGCPS
jgi:hypothetical protein